MSIYYLTNWKYDLTLNNLDPAVMIQNKDCIENGTNHLVSPYFDDK